MQYISMAGMSQLAANVDAAGYLANLILEDFAPVSNHNEIKGNRQQR